MSRIPVIAVDLDGTLARYDGWQGPEHIGDPIPEMLERVKKALALGYEVYVFTARASASGRERVLAIRAIEAWCSLHLGQVLPITATKMFRFSEFWDDRAVGVHTNTGKAKSTADLWEQCAPDPNRPLPGQMPLYGDG